MINSAGKQAYSSMHHHTTNLSPPPNKRKQKQQTHVQVTDMKQWSALLFLFVFIATSIHLYTSMILCEHLISLSSEESTIKRWMEIELELE